MHLLRTPVTNNHVQIIYLNGPSSSGKTTLAKALQHAFDDFFLHVGIDKIIGWMPEKVNDWTGGEAPLGHSWRKSTDGSGNLTQELQIGPYAEKIAKTFQEVVLVLAKMGHHIVIDDVSFGKRQLDEWKTTLKDFRVLWIGVNAPLPVLEQREKERGNRILGSARGQFHKVHVDTTYDLEINTHQSSISENVEKIKALALCPPTPIEPIKKIKVVLCKATIEDKNTIQNLGRFYVYEMSKYCGFLPTWETPSNGLFESIDLSSYFEKTDRYAFLIKVEDELAGFVLINKVGSTPDVDWNIGEFFIVSKFQGKGVGSYVAEQVFSQFPGVWETSQIPENTAAIKFWNKVVSRYSHGQFEKTLKTVPTPKPHPMIILKFTSQERVKDHDIDDSIMGLELKKNEGIEDLLIRPMYPNDIAKIVSRYSFPWSTPEETKALWDTYYREQQDHIRTVAILEKDEEILGYGSLLRKPECPFFAEKNVPEINAIWIDEDHRRKGLGTSLIKWLENLASYEGYNQIGIGVGLYGDYGPAQKLYFQLGYAPDGNGITYKGQPAVAGQTYLLDDDLLLWLSKALDRFSKESST